MADPITILIKKGNDSDSLSGGTATPQTPSAGGSVESSRNVTPQSKDNNSLTKDMIAQALIGVGKQYAMNAVSQFGNFTGNTVMQNKINNGIQLAALGLSIYANPVLGSIALIGQTAISITNNAIETSKANNQAALIRQRMGNAALNGGRGTNN